MNAYNTVNSDPAHMLIPPPSPGTIRAGFFWGLDKLISERGGKPYEILARKGLDRRIFEDPDNTLDCISYLDLLEYCSEVLNDPLFGMHLADYQTPTVFGCVVSLAQAAPTLRVALQCLIDFIPVSASPECEFKVVNAKNGLKEFQWQSDVGMGQGIQPYTHGLVIICKTLQLIGVNNLRPVYANLTLPLDQSIIKALSHTMGCKVNGKADYNAIGFSVKDMDSPLPGSNRLLFNILVKGLSEQRLSSSGDFSERVRSCIRQALTTGECSMENCASRLRMSPRTLQKKLKIFEYTFSELLSDERTKLAQHLLLWSELSLDQIGFQLGFSEQSSFGRAFKSATGYTPKAYRADKKNNSRTITQ